MICKLIMHHVIIQQCGIIYHCYIIYMHVYIFKKIMMMLLDCQVNNCTLKVCLYFISYNNILLE